MSSSIFSLIGESQNQISAEEYVGLRYSLNEKGPYLSDEELQDIVSTTFSEMTPEQIEGFWSSLKNIGKKILPGVVGGATSGAALGPWGALAGGLLGGLGSAFSKPSAKTTAQTSGKGGSASAQLLQLIQSPQLQQALTSLILGNAGRKTIPVGDQKQAVPVAAFMNLLGNLATKASEEAEEVNLGQNEEYLTVKGEESSVDSAAPDQRAEMLMNMLQEDDAFLNEESSDDPIEWLIEAFEDETDPITVIMEEE